MTTSVIISSPKPNNGLVIVMEQTIDADGAPVGDPTQLAQLDDGEQIHVYLHLHSVLSVLERPRNLPLPAAAPPAPPPADPETETVAVVGGSISVPIVAPPADAA